MSQLTEKLQSKIITDQDKELESLRQTISIMQDIIKTYKQLLKHML